MQKAQTVRLDKRVVARFLMLFVMFGLISALLLWLKAVGTDASSFSLPSKLQDFITLTLSVVIEALPFVILGALVSTAIRLFVSTQRIIQLLPKRPLLTTYQAFPLDPSIVWIRMAGALLIANLVGGLIALCKDQMELVSKGFYNTVCKVETAEDHHHHHAAHHHHDHHHASKRWQDGI